MPIIIDKNYVVAYYMDRSCCCNRASGSRGRRRTIKRLNTLIQANNIRIVSGDGSADTYTGKRTLGAIKSYLNEVRRRKNSAQALVFSYEPDVGPVGIDIETGERHAW